MRTKKTTIAAALAGSVLVLAGCGLGGPEEHEKTSYDVSQKVVALKVQGDDGDVVVTESDRQGIHVTEDLTWRKSKPATRHVVNGDELVVTYDCPRGNSVWGGSKCGVNYRVEVPRGLRVKVAVDSGTVTLRALSGPVEAVTDSGDIEGGELAGKRVVAEADSGDVKLTFAGQPDDVEVKIDSGNGVVRLPKAAYKVTARTDSGVKKIRVDNDPAAPRSIHVTVDSGDIEVSPV
ncbi:DUF4097 family beta strand repeat-containing protein [Streptosporangium sp. NPDC000396]|uniref:DUF4097 family beta strand repeat-containing protein n=1 Tax=Streptosporangium sp. NPDC000396 TaxID=3366185 RepID=UPI00369C7F47